MNILVIGSGAREHAIAWKLSRSTRKPHIFSWPSNPAMSDITTTFRFLTTSGENLDNLVIEAKNQRIDLVVCGPEGPLSEGLADKCQQQKIPIFGPTKKAARLESSKAFAKSLMARAGIPSANYRLAVSEAECREIAEKELASHGKVVLKCSGLAAGKGVFVCLSKDQIDEAVEKLYGPSMRKGSEIVVIEECLEGRECSFFAFLGGKIPTSLGFAVDFKRLLDDDQGPNTGGMGCYSPVPWLTEEDHHRVEQEILHPLLAELKHQEIDYKGCIYIGLMQTKDGFRVIEFNVRLGDPEAQVLAMQSQHDWAELFAYHSGLEKEATNPIPQSPDNSGASVAVVMAAEGYPYQQPTTPPNDLPKGLFANFSESTCIFGASVTQAEDPPTLRPGAGRVLTVCSKKPDFKQAREIAYKKVAEIAANWPLVQYRKDIALKTTKNLADESSNDR